jgi:hypothetical protein
MIKFVKGAGYYFPVNNLLGIDAATATVVDLHFPTLQGLLQDDKFDVSVTSGKETAVAEALIEEINFGKQVVIDCGSGGAFADVDGAVTVTEHS